jgi:hypothetical protein
LPVKDYGFWVAAVVERMAERSPRILLGLGVAGRRVMLATVGRIVRRTGLGL